MKIDFKNYLNRLNPILAYPVTFFSFFIVTMTSNGYCNPKSFYDFYDYGSGFYDEIASSLFKKNLEGYCEYYNKIFEGFFSGHSNTFNELFIFSLIVVVTSMILELFFHLFDKNVDHEELSKENRTLKQYFILRLIQVPVVYLFVWSVGDLM